MIDYMKKLIVILGLLLSLLNLQAQQKYDVAAYLYPAYAAGDPRFGESAVVKENTPERFEGALRKAKAWLDARPKMHKLLTINSWNEWTETSYLQPDDVNGYGYLDAVKKVFVDD